jgi:hypothetical protein
MRVICPYCQAKAARTSGKEIYPLRPEFAAKVFWACLPCGAWVGCYPGGDKPLGRLANKELRQAKVRAHEAFDPLWRSGELTRTDAYAWLAEQLGLSAVDCHIGMFDLDGCEAVCNAVFRRSMQ